MSNLKTGGRRAVAAACCGALIVGCAGFAALDRTPIVPCQVISANVDVGNEDAATSVVTTKIAAIGDVTEQAETVTSITQNADGEKAKQSEMTQTSVLSAVTTSANGFTYYETNTAAVTSAAASAVAAFEQTSAQSETAAAKQEAAIQTLMTAQETAAKSSEAAQTQITQTADEPLDFVESEQETTALSLQTDASTTAVQTSEAESTTKKTTAAETTSASTTKKTTTVSQAATVSTTTKSVTVTTVPSAATSVTTAAPSTTVSAASTTKVTSVATTVTTVINNGSTAESRFNAAKLSKDECLSGSDHQIMTKYLDKIIDDDMSNYEMALACYDYLIENTYYDYGGWSDPIKAVLEDGYGTCTEYSYVYACMLRYLGFDAKTVDGKTSLAAGGYGYHMWVEVTINGQVYVCDPQVDDNMSWGTTISHRRFCKLYSEVEGKYIKE